MEKLINCKLYKLNKKKTIFTIFSIPSFAQTKNYDFSSHYDFNYSEKKSNDKKKLTKDERKAVYLNVENKHSNLITERPLDLNSNDYRVIVNVKSKWLKTAQKKFHKLIIESLDNVPYLHSTIKKKSYATNAHEHLGKKYFLKLDLKNFFTYVEKSLVKSRLKYYLDIDGDVADFYSNMLTSAKDKPPYNEGVYNLGQGLPSSSTLAYLCHKSLFDYLYKICKINSIKMTIYVDDIGFSSDEPFTQEFIDRLFGLFKMNGLKISKKKFRYYKKDGTKKITGIFIKNGNPMVPSKKHEEIKYQYEFLLDSIETMTNIDDYFSIYNLFLKFAGNVQHLISSECAIDGIVNIKKPYMKYKNFINKFGKYFPRGKQKKNKNIVYNSSNVKVDDLKEFQLQFKKICELKELVC